MRRQFILAAALLSLTVLGLVGAGTAQAPSTGNSMGNEKAPSGPTPRTPEGKVDFSGVWDPGSTFFNIGQVPLQPWAQALYQERRSNLSKDDPEAKCLPAGVPRISPFPQKFVQTPTLVVILDEGNVHSYRQLFLDGRGHPTDMDPLWMGDSIAKWDGDTLVVDTIGFNEKTWLSGQGVPHTDRLHVVERYTRPDFGHLEVEITLEDPGAFTRTHTFKRGFILLTNWEIHEYVCNEFNIDKDHLVGK
jgi:hypothetical protein